MTPQSLPLISFLIFSLLLPSPVISDLIRLPSACSDLPATAASSCPVKCYRPDPVCGEDGVTYWCGCLDAHCAGTRVAKQGFCDVRNGGSGQAFLLVHIVWLIVLGFAVLCGFL